MQSSQYCLLSDWYQHNLQMVLLSVHKKTCPGPVFTWFTFSSKSCGFPCLPNHCCLPIPCCLLLPRCRPTPPFSPQSPVLPTPSSLPTPRYLPHSPVLSPTPRFLPTPPLSLHSPILSLLHHCLPTRVTLIHPNKRNYFMASHFPASTSWSNDQDLSFTLAP